MNPVAFEKQLRLRQSQVQDFLAAHISELPSGRLKDAIRHGVLNGGKRLRAYLVIESAAIFDVPEQDAIRVGAAIEAMHAYSLVHDDLPAMDDDDLRRGQPTVHVAFDEATAILVGDALQSMAFELLSDPSFSSGDIRSLLVQKLAYASGARGMVIGQMQDIEAETAKNKLDLSQITELQENKTGALIEWSATAGAFLAGENPNPLFTYSRALGLAFQIQDDVLDVEGDVSETGKNVQKDAAAGKATFVSLLGLEGAKAKSSELVSQAIEALSCYGDRAEPLRDVANFVISRRN